MAIMKPFSDCIYSWKTVIIVIAYGQAFRNVFFGESGSFSMEKKGITTRAISILNGIVKFL